MNRKLVWSVFILALSLMLACFTVRSWLPWFGMVAPFDTLHTVATLQNIHYDNQEQQFSLAPKIYSVSYPHQEQLTTIQFHFKATALKDHMLLFSSAPFAGIQLFLNKNSLVLVTPIDQPQPYMGQMGLNIAPNEWHTVKIVAWSWHSVWVTFDDQPPVLWGSLGITNPLIDFQISDVQVGAGTILEQNFQGQITDFQLTAKLIDLQHRQEVDRVIDGFFIFFALIALGVLAKLGMRPLSRAEKITYLSSFILFGFFIAVVFHYVLMTYWGAVYPKNTFMLLGSQFGDFFTTVLQATHLDPYRYAPSPAIYFPFSYLVAYPFSFFDIRAALVLYSVLYVLFMVYFVRLNFSLAQDNFKNIFIITFLSYPFLFAFERGNFEDILFMFTVLSVFFYQRKQFWATAVFLAMAGAMKVYPLFLLVLFLSDRRYLLTVKTVGLTLIFTLLALVVLHPGYYATWTTFLSVLKSNASSSEFFVSTCRQFNLGLWGLLKILAQAGFVTWPIQKLYSLYEVLLVSGLAFISAYVVFIETIFWRKLALIIAGILLFPIISYEYKLLYLFIPLAAFVAAKPERFDLGFLILFGLLFVPKNYYWVGEDISISGIVTPVILVVLSLVVIVKGVIKLFRPLL